nr:PREDICTED: helicase SRCAP [Lepisosteus oculatus]
MDTGDKPRETPAGAPGAADCPLQTDGPSPWPLSAAPAQLPDTPPFGDPPARAAEPRADSTASGPPGAAVEVPARAQASGLGTGEPSPAQSKGQGTPGRESTFLKLNKWITDRISPARPSSSSSSFSLSGWTPPVERHFTPLRGPHGKFISPPQRAPSTASSPGSPADSAQRHARGERSHSDIAELAKHEAEIEHRTAALKREGFWSLKRLSRVAEPSRPKVHWDYLCEEMQWLSADFAQERRWKRGVARKVVRMVMRHHEELRQKEERARREEQAKLRRIASSIAKEVRAFWSSVEKVVQFKQQSRLEEKRKKALDLQLDFIVGQTEKYSDLLSQSLSEAPAGSVLLPRHGAPVRPAPEEDDGDFEPQCEEEDDEETIEVEEQQEGNDAEAQRREIELLRQEGELPLDQLLQTLRAQTEAQDSSEGEGSHSTSRAPEEDEDDEFAANEDEAEDEEDTIAAQEVVEGDADHSQELSDLAREGEMSIEELMERYSGAYAEDFEVPSASESSSSSEEEQEEADEESVNTGEREEEDQSEAAEGDQSEEEESHCSDSSAALDSDDGRSSPGGDVGVAFLLKGDRSPPTPGEKVPIAPRPKKEISDIAATAESLQPKGYTLATTQVKTPIPFLLYGTLREYQHIGLDWLVTMYEKKLNGILADEMGLGKTIQTISLLAHLACEKGTESLGITGHSSLGAVGILGGVGILEWELLIWGIQRRLLLTGTPLQNSLMELWSLMHFLMPHVFQSHREFREWFSNPLTGMIEGSQEYNEGLVKRLHKVLRPFLLRRIKADVEKQMPKKYEHVVRCRLSKRQRFLYDDFMAQASTRETLASGHFMSVINILMQLRKVCNHPNLFDPRPIHSPFITPRILYTTASLALRGLDTHPFQRCDLSMFDLIGLEGRVTRYQADVFLPRRKVSRLLVQEVMDSPDPPPRPKPVRMKVNRMFQPLPKADGRTVVLVNSPRPPGPAPSPAPSPSPLLRPPVAPESAPVAAAPLPQQQHPAPPVTVCSVPPAALARPPLVPAGPSAVCVGGTGVRPGTPLPVLAVRPPGSPGTLLRTPTAPAASAPPLSGYATPTGGTVTQRVLLTPDMQARLPSGEVLSIAQLASLASRPVQSSQGSKPVTFQLQGNKLTLSGAQLHQVNMSQPRPVQGNVVHLVSSGGQHHLISQPAQVAVIQTVSQSSAGVVSTHQPTLPPGPPGLSLPLNATQVPSSMVSGSGIVKIVVRQSAGKEGVPTLAVPPTPLRPVLRVLQGPAAGTEQARLSATPGRDDSDVITLRVATPSGASPHLGGGLSTPRVRTQVPPPPRSPFYMSWLADRRKAQREARLSRILRVNEQHCSARPIYGQEVLRFLTVLDRPSAPSPDAPGHWLSSGYAHCLNAQSQAPDRYWERSEALSRVIQTPEQRIEQLSNVIDRFIFVIPPVEAPAVALHTSHPPPWLAHREAVFRERLRAELSPRTACLHRVHCNMRTQFPDLRLIQYDCGKLQTLHMLLRRLKAGGHRVLIFTQMTRMLDVLEQFLNYHGHIYLRLDGSTRVEQRQALMERFNADRRIFCFILSTRSGGVGVNLTGADTVVFYDSDWNPTMDAQAQDRCHRIGQTRDVHIYRLISERTVEENILKKANQKRMLGDMAIEGGNFTTAFFKQQTIRELFDLTEGERKEMEQPNQAPSRQEEEEALNNKHTSILEQALCRAEDEEDIAAASQAKAEQVAELAEFNENIPLEEGSEGAGREQEEEELSKAEQEIAALVEQLTPIERYAMNFLEASLEDVCKEELKQAEEQVEAARKGLDQAKEEAFKLPSDDEAPSAPRALPEDAPHRRARKTKEKSALCTRASGRLRPRTPAAEGADELPPAPARSPGEVTGDSPPQPRIDVLPTTLARPEPEAGARTEDNMPVQEASTACVSAPAPSLAPTLASASANPNPTPAPAPAPAPAQTLASASANPNPTPTPAPAPVQAPLVPAPEEDSTPQHRDVPEPAGLALQGDTKDELHLPSPPPLTRLATPEAHQLPEPAEPAPPSPQNNLLPDAGVGQPEGGGGGLPSPGPSSPPQPAACQAPRDPQPQVSPLSVPSAAPTSPCGETERTAPLSPPATPVPSSEPPPPSQRGGGPHSPPAPLHEEPEPHAAPQPRADRALEQPVSTREGGSAPGSPVKSERLDSCGTAAAMLPGSLVYSNADEAGQSSSPGHRAAELGTPPPQPPPASPLPSPGSSPPGSPPLPQAPARSPRKRVSADGEVLNSLQEGSPSAKVLRKLPGRLVTVVEEKELKRRRRGASGPRRDAAGEADRGADPAAEDGAMRGRPRKDQRPPEMAADCPASPSASRSPAAAPTSPLLRSSPPDPSCLPVPAETLPPSPHRQEAQLEGEDKEAALKQSPTESRVGEEGGNGKMAPPEESKSKGSENRRPGKRRDSESRDSEDRRPGKRRDSESGAEADEELPPHRKKRRVTRSSQEEHSPSPSLRRVTRAAVRGRSPRPEEQRRRSRARQGGKRGKRGRRAAQEEETEPPQHRRSSQSQESTRSSSASSSSSSSCSASTRSSSLSTGKKGGRGKAAVKRKGEEVETEEEEDAPQRRVTRSSRTDALAATATSQSSSPSSSDSEASGGAGERRLTRASQRRPEGRRREAERQGEGGDRRRAPKNLKRRERPREAGSSGRTVGGTGGERGVGAKPAGVPLDELGYKMPRSLRRRHTLQGAGEPEGGPPESEVEAAMSMSGRAGERR